MNLSESPNSLTGGIKREACRSPPPPAKRRTPRPPSPRASSPSRPASLPAQTHSQINGGNTNGVNGAAFKITTRGKSHTLLYLKITIHCIKVFHHSIFDWFLNVTLFHRRCNHRRSTTRCIDRTQRSYLRRRSLPLSKWQRPKWS